MKNYNFTLTKDNANVFVIRLKKLLSVTGCMVSVSEYTGRQEISGWLTSLGLKRGRCYANPVCRTSPHYCLESQVKFRVTADSVYVYDSEDTMPMIVNYGTKIKFTSNSIKYTYVRDFGMPNKGAVGMRKVFSIFGNLQSAQARVRMERQYADDYWKDYEAQMMKELKEETWATIS